MLGAKAAIYGIAALAVLSIIGLGYAHYAGLVEDNARLRENEAKLTLALETQRAATEAAVDAVDQWRLSSEELGRRMQEMTEVQVRATAETRRLNDIFARHDLEALALAKPGLIERRVNSGTSAVLGVLECATGGGSGCPSEGGPADRSPPAGPGAD